jgi:hypothetical protein
MQNLHTFDLRGTKAVAGLDRGAGLFYLLLTSLHRGRLLVFYWRVSVFES